jgi:hypothetical protein|tara:strand:- start:2682 stop:3077 length:396 start_codon:yes stop_codon:yes gene_type:complete
MGDMTNKQTEGRMSYDFNNTISGKLINQLRLDLMEVIEVSNALLPEDYQNHKTGGRTLADVEKLYRKKNAQKIKLDEKAIKEARLEKYIEQYDETGEITYDEDDDKLYRHQSTFCRLAVEAGWLDESDFEN